MLILPAWVCLIGLHEACEYAMLQDFLASCFLSCGNACRLQRRPVQHGPWVTRLRSQAKVACQEPT